MIIASVMDIDPKRFKYRRSSARFGLHPRKFLTRTFMSMAIAKGLDTAILDPLDK
jgi:hypothetical protein